MGIGLTSMNAGFVLALTGVLALLNVDALVRLDAHLPSQISELADKDLSRRLVEISSAGVLGVGAILLLVGLIAR